MIIKTITCHDVYNYGASLQAYALQKYLEFRGHQVEIIDYKPEYLQPKSFWFVPQNSHYYKLAKNNKLIHIALCLYFAYKRFPTRGRKKQFDRFTKKYLKLTRRYNSYSELQANPPSADYYIAGSDQIWNSVMENGKDPAFYLNFGSQYIKKISYAASFAISQIPKDEIGKIKIMLKTLDSISVRETTGLKILDDLEFKGTVVLDPVCLLTKTQWEEVAGYKNIIKGNYLIIYDLTQNDNRIEETAKYLAKKYDLKIITIATYTPLKYATKNILNAGPIEFLNLIKNATFVLSNSFHATAFSVILNRPFAVYYKESNISRMADFLASLNLESQLNPTKEALTIQFEWKTINQKFDLLRNKSISFLEDNKL